MDFCGSAQFGKQKMLESPVAAGVLGGAYYRAGRPLPAIAQLKGSAAKLPRNFMYRYHFGMAYVAVHRPEPAEHSLRAALRTDPAFVYAAAPAAFAIFPKEAR